ncbi:C-type lectin domain family 1 member B-like [Chrysemys picta bellii]|uniref:C-type lectin domain family 1 member B-like n=1 Tax=Chrysemys picta bellii TaxID=8478 RepID=UPI0032B20F6B
MEDEDGYTILNFRSRNPAFTHEPSGTNKGITPPKAPDVPSESIPLPSKWRCTALILGILCLTLLVTAGILGIQGHKCNLCPENWFWYGQVCYHLSTEWKTWQGSKDYCSSHDSRLLKIENKEELVMSFPSSLTVDTKRGMNAAMGVGFILHVHIATDKMIPPMHCILGQNQGKLGRQCITLEKVIKDI